MKSFVMVPGGKLVLKHNRFGGENKYGHDRYSALERRRCLTRVLDREFALMVNEVGQVEDDEPEREVVTTWTVLEPCSRFRHTVTFVIEGDSELATRVYAARNGGRHPEKVSCDCGCGPDYFVTELFGSLRTVTTHLRNCNAHMNRFGETHVTEGRARANPSRWEYHTLEQFLARDDVRVIASCDISDDERITPMPVRSTPSDYPDDVRTVAWLLNAEL
jgi:hypothetical protein